MLLTRQGVDMIGACAYIVQFLAGFLGVGLALAGVSLLLVQLQRLVAQQSLLEQRLLV